MAEQDVYGNRLGGHSVPFEKLTDRLPHTSGAEQDVYGSHFRSPGGSLSDRLPRTSGAEQDVYASRFGGHPPPLERAANHLPRASGAEQDVYGSRLRPAGFSGTTALGLLQSTVLPSFSLHAAFSTVAYGIARYSDRVEGKDWLWPAGITANAWWSSIGSRIVLDRLSVPDAFASLNYSQKLLLTGVTAWGARLFYRVATRSLRRGKDDPRYEAQKKQPGYWNKSLFTTFLPEAVAQTLISLPFTLPFRATTESAIASPILSYSSWYQGLAVFLFSSGFALELLADSQLESHKSQASKSGVCRDGVWSIVRHPNYLGDALIHASFPLVLLGAGLYHPLAVLGPIANYVFLRFIGGDRENEQSQEERYSKNDAAKAQQFDEYRKEKNSFWPGVKELTNKWTLIVAAAGVAGVALEQGARAVLA